MLSGLCRNTWIVGVVRGMLLPIEWAKVCLAIGASLLAARERECYLRTSRVGDMGTHRSEWVKRGKTGRRKR